MRWFKKGWWMVTAFMIECTDRYVTWDRGYAVMWMSRGSYHDLWESWEKRDASPAYIPLYTCWRKFCPTSLVNLQYHMRQSNQDVVYKYNSARFFFFFFFKLYISGFWAFFSKLFGDFLAETSDRIKIILKILLFDLMLGFNKHLLVWTVISLILCNLFLFFAFRDNKSFVYPVTGRWCKTWLACIPFVYIGALPYSTACDIHRTNQF